MTLGGYLPGVLRTFLYAAHGLMFPWQLTMMNIHWCQRHDCCNDL
jgi:hypothetical protein